MLINTYGARHALSAFRTYATRVREARDLGVILLKPGYPKLAKILGAMADVHLKVTQECEVPIVYGIKSRTDFYAFEMDVSNGCAMPNLHQ